MKVSTILLIMAAVALALFVCCMVAAWREGRGKKKDHCKNCPGNIKGRCDCMQKKGDPCATCWEMEYKICEGCHRRNYAEHSH